MMKWFKVTVSRIGRYLSYLWEGIKTRWKSFSKIGLFGFITGFFKNFFESWTLLRMDIKGGYI